MTTFGYARVSSEDQDLSAQREALKAAGCEMIREEKASGKSRDGRDELAILLDFIRPGDVLIVTKLDRLARNTLDMLEIVETLAEKGAGFKSLAEPWADTTSPAGKLVVTIFAGFAEFERARIRERQREGIERAKARGVYVGRKRQHDPERIRERRAEGLSMSRIAAELGCSEDTVRRALRQKNGQPAKLAELGAPGI